MSNTKLPVSGGGENGVSETPSPELTVPNPGDDGGDIGSDGAGRPGPRPRRFIFVVAAAVLMLDQLSKIWATSALADRDIDLFWTLRLHLIRNTGSAFGVGSDFGRWLGLVVIGVVIGVIVYARRVTDRRILFLLAGIVGGAVGNLIDRFVRADDGVLSGGVIDFIDLQWWPVFNVADMAVVCGAIGLMLLTSVRSP